MLLSLWGKPKLTEFRHLDKAYNNILSEVGNTFQTERPHSVNYGTCQQFYLLLLLCKLNNKSSSDLSLLYIGPLFKSLFGLELNPSV